MPKYVLDTNVYIRAMRSEAASRELDAFVSSETPFVYLHSVVALELLAGAVGRVSETHTRDSFIAPFERRGRVVTPSHQAWKRAASALSWLVREKRVSPDEGIWKSLVNDCLIAASALDEGFVLVTANTKDFALIQPILPLEYVPPWP